MKRGSVVFICLFLMISLSFVSAGLFNKNKVTGEVIGQTTFSCDSLFSEFQYYFYICAQNNHESVCFNKFSKVYQGCGDASGLYCTSNNVNAAQNIACSTENGLDGCMDSDGGLNTDVYGTVIGPDEYGTGNPGADYCWSDGRGVIEGYCNSKGYANFYSSSCPNGCVHGVCVHYECEIDADCGANYICINGNCKFPCECISNDVCDPGAVCKDCECVLQTEVNQSSKPDFTIKGFEFWNGDTSLHAGYYDRPISFKIINKGATVMSAILYANLSI